VSAKKTDISQIRKYLSGELDARGMHELERQALDDPFLMDTMEGYEGNNQNQQANLDSLNNLLQQRITQNKQRSLWPAIAIAASVLLVMTVGGLWLFHHPDPLNQGANRISANKVTVTKSTPKPSIPTLKNPPVTEELTVLKPVGVKAIVKRPIRAKQKAFTNQMQKSDFNKLGLADMRVAESKAKNDTSKVNMLSEVVVKGYSTLKKTEVTASVSVISAAPLQNKLQGRVAGINIAGKADKSSDSVGARSISGQVLSKSDGRPLPGVSVSVAGKSKGVLTDANGQFNIQVTKEDELGIAYIGFKSEHLKVKGKDSLKVLLAESQTSLAEVVVAGNNNIEQVKEAHPAIGWDNFNRYLKDKAESPNGKTGTVRLTFIVNSDNSLSDFKIIRSLSQIADQHAVELIKQGPLWIHNQNKKPELIKIDVRF
jgi:hypothetical protein